MKSKVRKVKQQVLLFKNVLTNVGSQPRILEDFEALKEGGDELVLVLENQDYSVCEQQGILNHQTKKFEAPNRVNKKSLHKSRNFLD